MSFLSWVSDLLQSGTNRRPYEGGRSNCEAFPPLEDLVPLLPGTAGSSETALSMLLALGNTFRDKGDIERAVRFREKLLNAADTDEAKGAIFFELGRDYRKAGLIDRAMMAFGDARRAGYPEKSINEEMAYIHADSGDFAAAASEFGKIGMPQAEACFLVRQAEEEASAGQDGEAFRLLGRAVDIYPCSPEARLSLATMSLLGDDPGQSLEQTQRCMESGDASTRLILLEGLRAFITGPNAPDVPARAFSTLMDGIALHAASEKPDAVLCYYIGLLMLHGNNMDGAEQWFTKSLVVDPSFWAARLAILTLSSRREQLPLLLAQQIDFFRTQGENSKRFVCPPCGMRRDTIFSFCPRCQTWHTAAFRMRIT